MGVCTLIGNSVGENNVVKAKIYYKYCIYIAIFVSITICALLNIFKHQIPYIFTHEENVTQMIVDLMPYLSVFCAVDVL